MSYEIAKIILLVFLCVPMILLALCLTANIFGENYKIRRRRKLKMQKKSDAERRLRESAARRKRFEEEYDRIRGGYE